MQKKILTAAFLALFSTAVYADGITAARAFNDNVRSFSGSFSQSVKSAKKTQKSSGTFAVLRPGYFKWTYDKPMQQLIVGDGKYVWLYDQDLEQVTRRTQSTTLGASPAAILADKATMERNYTLKDDGQKDGIDYVAVEPKSKDSEYRHIRLGFKETQLVTMQLEDGFGNFTTITFNGMNINPQLAPSAFRFTPPAGVDVLTEE
ncbi:MAG: outer membrane lipoprotein chaperone LolA [Neisseria sp.]|nr:outer membrane lipoprotein chaperone LolA [Neisseria sp.]